MSGPTSADERGGWSIGDRVVVTHDDDESGAYLAGETGKIIPQEDWDDEVAITCSLVRFDTPQSHHVYNGTAWVAHEHLTRAQGGPDHGG